VTPETDEKRCVKEGKMGEEKHNCNDSASLRRAGKILARTVGIPSGSWICLKHSNEMNRNDKLCSCPSSWGHSWPKYRSQTACTSSLTRWENLFCTTNLGKTGALNAKSRRTKKFKEHGKYTPRKRKTCNKQKLQQFLNLISVSSRCTD